MTTSARPGRNGAKRAARLLIVSPKAGSMTPEIEAKLRKAFATIGWVVREPADTKHPVGTLSMGTFNNFAKSLHLPTTIDAAIRLIKTGKPHPITLGRLNGKVFLEAAAIGLSVHAAQVALTSSSECSPAPCSPSTEKAAWGRYSSSANWRWSPSRRCGFTLTMPSSAARRPPSPPS
jgi:hypothetical protein